MKKLLLVVGLFLVLGTNPASGFAGNDCPTTATCAEHGMNGNPTGQYKWQGATEYAQFEHPLPDSGSHKWWEKCD
jgi:hypothetical protein